MSEPQTSPAPTEIFQPRLALFLGFPLLAALAIIVICNAVERPRISQLERFEETTAVGDLAYFRPPDTAQKPPAAAATFHGQELFPVSYRKVELRDTKMIRAGEDDAGKWRIYTSREPVPPQEGEAEKKGETFYFLKIGPGEYVKTRVGSPGM